MRYERNDTDYDYPRRRRNQSRYADQDYSSRGQSRHQDSRYDDRYSQRPWESERRFEERYEDDEYFDQHPNFDPERQRGLRNTSTYYDQEYSGRRYAPRRESRFHSGSQDFESPSNRSRYQGVGPKDYRRSDDRIKEEACDRLTDDDDVNAEDISVSVEGGEVHLNGTVSDRETKRRAEDCCGSISGVQDVINELRVKPSNVHSIQRESQEDDESQSKNTQGKKRARG